MNESVPEPEPRSSTVSPGSIAARSSMWPTPANEASAAGGDASSQLGRVAEPLGERPAGLEVQVAAGIAGDDAVHGADACAQLRGVDKGAHGFS